MCDHASNVLIKMPSVTGKPLLDQRYQCPFAWCRQCGAVWLPKLPSFDRAFENHQKERGFLPSDDVTIEGYWVLPGASTLILPGN